MIASSVTDADHAGRIGALRDALHRHGLDAIVLYGVHRDYQPADLRYFARWCWVAGGDRGALRGTARSGA